jgi:nicotinate phosphoribosyltransferase
MDDTRLEVYDSSTALLTDHYKLAMLASVLADGTADRDCVFEVFARRLPPGRRYGVVAGTSRALAALADFRFSTAQLAHLEASGKADDTTLRWLADYRFRGDIDGYAEGEVYFPGSPILTLHATFAETVLLDTLILGIYNHDSAIAAGAARMASVAEAQGRSLIAMGSRQTHEYAAVAAARVAHMAGFIGTNLESGYRYGLPTFGNATAHSYTLVHDSEEQAFRSQVEILGAGTNLLVDTYDITQGIATAVKAAGTRLGSIRIDSGDVGVLAAQARAQLDSLGATETKIIVSNDLDEHAIAALHAAPIDVYGVGTALVTGSGAPTAGLVYKLVEVEGRAVGKRSPGKADPPYLKTAFRRHGEDGTALEEILYIRGDKPAESGPQHRPMQVPLVRGGHILDVPTLDETQQRLRQALASLPGDGLDLSPGAPAIPTMYVRDAAPLLAREVVDASEGQGGAGVSSNGRT